MEWKHLDAGSWHLIPITIPDPQRDTKVQERTLRMVSWLGGFQGVFSDSFHLCGALKFEYFNETQYLFVFCVIVYRIKLT